MNVPLSAELDVSGSRAMRSGEYRLEEVQPVMGSSVASSLLTDCFVFTCITELGGQTKRCCIGRFFSGHQ